MHPASIDRPVPECRHLTPTKTRPSQKPHHATRTRLYRVGAVREPGQLVGGEEPLSPGTNRRWFHPFNRIGDDHSIVDSLFQRSMQHLASLTSTRRREPLLGHLGHPPAHSSRRNRLQRKMAERWKHLGVEQPAVSSMSLRLEVGKTGKPAFCPLLIEDRPSLRVHPGSSVGGRLLRSKPFLRVDLAMKSLRVLPSVGCPIPGEPRLRPADALHTSHGSTLSLDHFSPVLHNSCTRHESSRESTGNPGNAREPSQLMRLSSSEAISSHLETLPAGRLTSTPGGTRTPNLLIRSQTLCPFELRAHTQRDGDRLRAPKGTRRGVPPKANVSGTRRHPASVATP